jgi:hypothetical protein
VPRLHVFRQARLLVLEWTLDAGPVAGLQGDAMTQAFEEKAARMDALYQDKRQFIRSHPFEIAFTGDREKLRTLALWCVLLDELFRLPEFVTKK